MTLATEALQSWASLFFEESDHLADAVVEDVEALEETGKTEQMVIEELSKKYLMEGAHGRLAWLMVLASSFNKGE